MNIVLVESSHFSVIFPFLIYKVEVFISDSFGLIFQRSLSTLDKNNSTIHYTDHTHTHTSHELLPYFGR